MVQYCLNWTDLRAQVFSDQLRFQSRLNLCFLKASSELCYVTNLSFINQWMLLMHLIS